MDVANLDVPCRIRLDHWLVERSSSGNLDESVGTRARGVAHRKDLLTITQVDWLICREDSALAQLGDPAVSERVDDRVAATARQTIAGGRRTTSAAPRSRDGRNKDGAHVPGAREQPLDTPCVPAHQGLRPAKLDRW